MAIKINNQDLQARYINWNSIAKVMLNGGQIRPETVPPQPDPDEYIIYWYNVNTVGTTKYIVVPTGWVGHDGNWGCSYNWKIRYRRQYSSYRSNPVTYTWTSSDTGYFSIALPSGSTWTKYEVEIRPVYDSYWWALAFSRYSVYQNYATRVYDLIHDATYKWYAVSATHTWDYFRYHQYEHCLYNVAESLPNTVTTIWNHFREWQYYGGRFQWYPEVLPNSVTSIWDNFRHNQFFNAKNTGSASTQSTPTEAMSSNVTVIGDNFRAGQYGYSDMVYQPATEVLPSGITSIGDNFRESQYSHNSFTVATTPTEVLPDSVQSIWTWFRSYQYRASGITNISWWKDLAIWNTDYRLDQYYQCTIDTITTLSDVGYEMAWRDQTSQSWWWIEYVSQINVPSAYVNNYKTTNKFPRYWVIDKNLFVWY